jgi:hypothetical protein
VAAAATVVDGELGELGDDGDLAEPVVARVLSGAGGRRRGRSSEGAWARACLRGRALLDAGRRRRDTRGGRRRSVPSREL